MCIYIFLHTLQYSTLQYSTVHFNTVRNHTAIICSTGGSSHNLGFGGLSLHPKRLKKDEKDGSWVSSCNMMVEQTAPRSLQHVVLFSVLNLIWEEPSLSNPTTCEGTCPNISCSFRWEIQRWMCHSSFGCRYSKLSEFQMDVFGISKRHAQLPNQSFSLVLESWQWFFASRWNQWSAS